MKILTFIKWSANELKGKGPYRGVRSILARAVKKRHILGETFDEGRGLETAGNTAIWKLDIASRNAHLGEDYQPTQEKNFEAALSQLGLDFPSYSFIDLGCGKGKSIILAKKYDFARYVGVEFASNLVEIARKNLSRANIENAEIICVDAAEFKFPDSKFVLYMYNPFKSEIMQHVVMNLELSRADFYVVYCHAMQSDILDACVYLRRLDTIETDPPTLVWRRIARSERD